MYRIRFHGRGGQGIKTAANLLARALFEAGFEVQDAPRYGAERRGAPLTASVRAAHSPIAERGVVTRPDLVLVADETLVAVPAAAVLQGLHAATVFCVRSAETAETWRRRLALAGPVFVLPCEAAAETPHPAPAGSALAGAAARLLGVVSREHLAAAVARELEPLGARVVERECAAALQAFESLAAHGGSVAESAAPDARAYDPPRWVTPTPEPVTRAAPDIDTAATSLLSPTGLWRSARPVIDHERCNRCAWICSTLCPDSAIAIDAGHAPVIDYEHCKGCMVCVTVCPPHAIHIEPEHAHEAGARAP